MVLVGKMYGARHKRPHVIVFIWSRICQSRETNQISGYQGEGGCLLNEYRVSFWSNRNPLDHDHDDVCTMLGCTDCHKYTLRW